MYIGLSIYGNSNLGNVTTLYESGNANSIGNSHFTIAIVSIVFIHRDFLFEIVCLDTKRKLNGNRMYMWLHPMHFSKIIGL